MHLCVVVTVSGTAGEGHPAASPHGPPVRPSLLPGLPAPTASCNHPRCASCQISAPVDDSREQCQKAALRKKLFGLAPFGQHGMLVTASSARYDWVFAAGARCGDGRSQSAVHGIHSRILAFGVTANASRCCFSSIDSCCRILLLQCCYAAAMISDAPGHQLLDMSAASYYRRTDVDENSYYRSSRDYISTSKECATDESKRFLLSWTAACGATLHHDRLVQPCGEMDLQKTVQLK